MKDRSARRVLAANRLDVALLLAMLMLGGCVALGPSNPSFPLTVAQAEMELQDMAQAPQPLARPVIVLGGFLDPGLVSGHVQRQLVLLTGDKRIVEVSFLFCGSFEACRRKVIEAVDRAFPSGDPIWTAEVDVVGVSMGGLVARYAAAESDEASEPGRRRLRIARLFTIATPHQGAQLAGLPTWDRVQIDMRPDSPFLALLNDPSEAAPYAIFPYVRLDDVVVGPANAAPPQQPVWWLPNRLLEPAHVWAYRDPRILADIARRLRGEPPLTHGPPAPLPPSEGLINASGTVSVPTSP